MGEICKGPARSKEEASDPETIINILKYLIVSDGLAQLIRKIQYSLEDLAETAREAPGTASNAEKYTRAAETLEGPYNTVKNEIKL